MNEKYWQEMYERYDWAPKVPCLDDLLELAQHDALIRAFVKSWTSGAMTFEQMAVGLVRELAERCRRYSENELRRLREEAPAAVVKKVGDQS